MTCLDCGDPSRSALCAECAKVAEGMGFTVEERLALIDTNALPLGQ